MILLGITRKTPPIPLRSRKKLQRKRADARRSRRRSRCRGGAANSSRFRSGAIGQQDPLGVRGGRARRGPGSGLISPSWRTMGGEPTDMCRSEAFMSNMTRNSSSISAVGPLGLPPRRGAPAPRRRRGGAPRRGAGGRGRAAEREAGLGRRVALLDATPRTVPRPSTVQRPLRPARRRGRAAPRR